MTAIPTLEGRLFPDNRHPVFAKALTYNARVIELPPGFLRDPAYLARARRLVVRHYKRYVQMPVSRTFPISRYVLTVSPGRAIAFDVDGSLIGIDGRVLAGGSFTVVGKEFKISCEYSRRCV